MITSLKRSMAHPWPASQVLQLYIWFVMALLLVQGSGSLALRLSPALEAATPWLLATIMNGNVPHAILHIVWGPFGLVWMFTLHEERERLTLGFLFGAFYTLLGFLGIIFLNPFGLRLGWPENLFHLVVGPLMLMLSLFAWRTPERILWRGWVSSH